MGGFFSNAITNIMGKKQMNITITGLENAGKTTVFYKVKNPMDMIIPTIGFNIETTTYKNYQFSVYDVGGSDMKRVEFNRGLYKLVNNGKMDGLIWMVDSNDINNDKNNNITCSKQELHFLLNQAEFEHIPLLIFSNKMDLPNIMDLDHVLHQLDITNITQNWFAIQTVATTGDGLYEGFEWIAKAIKYGTRKKINYIPEYVPNRYHHKLIDGIHWFSKERHEFMLKNRKKTILLISGWIRNIDNKYKLNITSGLTRICHQFYQDPAIPFDHKYSYYP